MSFNAIRENKLVAKILEFIVVSFFLMNKQFLASEHFDFVGCTCLISCHDCMSGSLASYLMFLYKQQ